MFDRVRGVEVADIPTPHTWALGFEHDGALVTYSEDGPFRRWPIRTDAQAGIMYVGPPQTIWDRKAWDPPPSASADMRVLGLPARSHALLLHRPNKEVELAKCEDTRHCAISPDGRWAATGNHNCLSGIGAQVWDARTRECVKNLPVGGVCDVAFSPNGRWLLTTGGGYRLWRVESWEEGPTIAQSRGENGAFAQFAFSRDSGMLALAAGVGQVRLVNPDTGSEIACLSVPEQTVV
jgi:WD40 repeat protein